MKTILTSLLILFVGIKSFANTAEDDFNVVIGDNKTLYISLSHVKDGEHLRVLKNNGDVVFEKKLATMPFYQKNLKLKGYEDGIYYIEFHREYKTHVRPLTKYGSSISFVDVKNVTYKTNFNHLTDRTLDVKGWCTDKDVTISVYKEGGMLMETKVFKNHNAPFRRKYNFKTLPSGTFTFKIYRGEEQVEEKQISL